MAGDSRIGCVGTGISQPVATCLFFKNQRWQGAAIVVPLKRLYDWDTVKGKYSSIICATDLVRRQSLHGRRARVRGWVFQSRLRGLNLIL
jgi:hypothetical protein